MRFLLSLLAAGALLPAHASDFGSLGALSQGQFRRLSEDLGAAFSYKGVTPGVPLGTTGLDIGVEVTDTRMQNSEVFAAAGAGGKSHLLMPKLHVTKGIFGGFDIAAFAGGASDIGAGLFGGEMRYTFLDGVALPAIAARLSGTMSTGMGDLRVGTASADLMVSKTLVAITPYLGGGVTRVQSKAVGTALRTEKFDQGRVFGGVNVNLVGANVALELEKAGDNTSISAKVGWRF
ncbi:MAG: hypothetical protein ACXWG3_15210 [Usitatibacter sp.]